MVCLRGLHTRVGKQGIQTVSKRGGLFIIYCQAKIDKRPNVARGGEYGLSEVSGCIGECCFKQKET